MSGPSPEELQGRIDAWRERYAVAGVAVGTGVYQPVFMSFEDGRRHSTSSPPGSPAA
ncbi:MAG TPA: hypothetical protein VNM91_01755 [Dehalococcoidia bacterium]|nr:hypothetical protein [Dehalococcoidia bacterium]